jgi:4-hydroxybenzoate polyprenyltransferase
MLTRARLAASYFTALNPTVFFLSGITAIVGVAFVPNVPAMAGILIASAGFLAFAFADSVSESTHASLRGESEMQDIATVGLIGLTAIAMIFVSFSPTTIVLFIAAAGAYGSNAWFKRRWWAGPLWKASIVVLLAMMSSMAARGATVNNPLAPDTSRSGLLVAFGVIFFGYANIVLISYFQKIAADRAERNDTLPVRFGRRVASIVSDVLALLTVALALLAWDLIGGFRAVPAPAILFLIAGIVEAIHAEWNLHHVHSDRTAHYATQPADSSYVLLLSSIVLVLEPTWSVGMALYLVCYVLALRNGKVASRSVAGA